MYMPFLSPCGNKRPSAERGAGFQIEQVGTAIVLQPVVVLAQELVIRRTGDNDQPAYRVLTGAEVREQVLQIGQTLLS